MSTIILEHPDVVSSAHRSSQSDSWESHKDLIKQKYLAERFTTKQLRRFMLEQHGFQRSLQQYERIFTKWNFRKKRSHDEYKYIARELKRRHLDADGVEVTLGGKHLSGKKLKKELSRHVRPTLFSSQPSIPNGIQRSRCTQGDMVRRDCQTPEISFRQILAPGRTLCAVQAIPWLDFIDNLLEERIFSQLSSNAADMHNLSMNGNLNLAEFDDSIVNIKTNSLDARVVSCHKPSLWDTLWHARYRLEPLIPERFPNDFHDSLRTITHGRASAAALVAASYISYLLANNLIEDCKWEQCARYVLAEEGNRLFIALARSSSGTARAATVVLFREICQLADLVYVKCLLGERQLDVNSIFPQSSIDQHPSTPLQTVVKHVKRQTSGYFEFIECLLKLGADPNTCGCHGSSANDLAACMIEAKPRHDNKTCCRELPLHMAMRQDDCPRLIKLLLDFGARVCACLDLTPGIANGIDVGLLEELLKQGARASRRPQGQARFDHPITCYWFPLQAALGMRQSDMAVLLLEYGADLNELVLIEEEAELKVSEWLLAEGPDAWEAIQFLIRLPEWRSPLALSLDFDVKIAKRLLELGACADEPLHDRMRDWCVWEMLLDDNLLFADPHDRFTEMYYPGGYWIDSKDVLGVTKCVFETALETTVKSRDIEAAKMLLRAGASPNHSGQIPALVFAASTGQYDMVRLLLQSGADVNSLHAKVPLALLWAIEEVIPTLLSPLAAAAARDDTVMVSTLIEAGADVNSCHQQHGLTALQAAIFCNAQKSFRMLLDYPQTDLSSQGTRLQLFESMNLWVVTAQSRPIPQRCDALAAAIQAEVQRAWSKELSTAPIDASSKKSVDPMCLGDPWARIRRLASGYIDVPADINLSSLLGLIDHRILHPYIQDSVNSAFAHAIDTQNFDVASSILQKGYAPGLNTIHHLLTAIYESEWHRCLTLETLEKYAKLVLDSQNWDLIAEEASTLIAPLMRLSHKLTLRCQESQVAREVRGLVRNLIYIYLDRTGCPCHRFDTRKGSSLVEAAAAVKDLELLRSLLNHDHNTCEPCSFVIDVVDDALWNACCMAAEGVVCELIVYGANVNRYVNPLGNTLLTIACSNNQSAIVRMLLSGGARVDVVSKAGLAALAVASQQGHLDIVAELITWGAKINAKASVSKGARTALQAACDGGHLDVVILLINKGADVNASPGPDHGVTALQAACIRGCFKIVQILIGAGAKISAPASRINGRTAIDGAAEWGRLDIVKFLLDKHDGDESIAVVCKRAAIHARRHGHATVVELLAGYPGSDSDSWGTLQPEEPEESEDSGDDGCDGDCSTCDHNRNGSSSNIIQEQESGDLGEKEMSTAACDWGDHHLQADVSRNEFDDMLDLDWPNRDGFIIDYRD